MLSLSGPPPSKHVVKLVKGTYIVPRGDNRVVVGSTMEDVGFDERVTAEGINGIRASAFRLLPALRSATLGPQWAGLRPKTPDGLPILGPAAVAGLVYATGHFRNGILLAPITARLIAQVISGESTSVDLRPFRCGRFST